MMRCAGPGSRVVPANGFVIKFGGIIESNSPKNDCNVPQLILFNFQTDIVVKTEQLLDIRTSTLHSIRTYLKHLINNMHRHF
jgi:recombinational DNA repair protein (RecF pathway)